MDAVGGSYIDAADGLGIAAGSLDLSKTSGKTSNAVSHSLSNSFLIRLSL